MLETDRAAGTGRQAGAPACGRRACARHRVARKQDPHPSLVTVTPPCSMGQGLRASPALQSAAERLNEWRLPALLCCSPKSDQGLPRADRQLLLRTRREGLSVGVELAAAWRSPRTAQRPTHRSCWVPRQLPLPGAPARLTAQGSGVASASLNHSNPPKSSGPVPPGLLCPPRGCGRAAARLQQNGSDSQEAIGMKPTHHHGLSHSVSRADTSNFLSSHFLRLHQQLTLKTERLLLA